MAKDQKFLRKRFISIFKGDEYKELGLVWEKPPIKNIHPPLYI
jgi:hypothetical protein